MKILKKKDEEKKKDKLRSVFSSISKKVKNSLPSLSSRRPTALPHASRKIKLQDLRLDGSTVPTIIRHCLEYLEKTGITTEGLYRTSGKYAKLNTLMAQVQANETINMVDESPMVIASLLKAVIRALDEPLIPRIFSGDAGNLVASKKLDALFHVLSIAPVVHQHTFATVFLHLRKVIAHSDSNRMTAAVLSRCTAPSLFGNVAPPVGDVASNSTTADEIRRELHRQEELVVELLSLPQSKWEELFSTTNNCDRSTSSDVEEAAL
ncbi:hypothetical protein QR680_001386 [Steinernema hermaphroditum]|uniref:Rho-GAP domain-containing protein n=1 Tax=Steinernema hermaphroditum TaxID=289476 RepID=A0AA39H0V9_9BILA|nr:hypothetical protein QR680_001386 [Steinernema hermaphroditum]